MRKILFLNLILFSIIANAEQYKLDPKSKEYNSIKRQLIEMSIEHNKFRKDNNISSDYLDVEKYKKLESSKEKKDEDNI